MFLIQWTLPDKADQASSIRSLLMNTQHMQWLLSCHSLGGHVERFWQEKMLCTRRWVLEFRIWLPQHSTRNVFTQDVTGRLRLVIHMPKFFIDIHFPCFLVVGFSSGNPSLYVIVAILTELCLFMELAGICFCLIKTGSLCNTRVIVLLADPECVKKFWIIAFFFKHSTLCIHIHVCVTRIKLESLHNSSGFTCSVNKLPSYTSASI